ncbi:MAG: SGNH/GDSL hydrolase family protein [Clostridia bacterium]|nr:SGNH/GDSL hydrolase family protein [Clostridia bacterium]
MDWNKYFYNENEKPLDKLVEGYSRTSVFRKVAFVGDSLSSGEFETLDPEGNRGYYDLYDYSWGQYIARKNGFLAYNFSRGGMTAQEYMESFAEANCMWDKSKACQAYVIALGVNDLINLNVELGSIDDIDVANYKNNKPTFAGYYAQIIQRYKEIAPDAKFFFVTFPNSGNPAILEKTQGMIQLLYDFAEHFSNSYVIDLYKYGPVYDSEFEKKFYLHSHMNPSGYILTAQMIDSYIDYIVRHNPKDFAEIGFVNTNIQYKF